MKTKSFKCVNDAHFSAPSFNHVVMKEWKEEMASQPFFLNTRLKGSFVLLYLLQSCARHMNREGSGFADVTIIITLGPLDT